jgi:hypothetical protein
VHQHWNQEGEGFARASLRYANDISARKAARNCLALNGRWNLIAKFRNLIHNPGVNVQMSEFGDGFRHPLSFDFDAQFSPKNKVK